MRVFTAYTESGLHDCCAILCAEPGGRENQDADCRPHGIGSEVQERRVAGGEKTLRELDGEAEAEADKYGDQEGSPCGEVFFLTQPWCEKESDGRKAGDIDGNVHQITASEPLVPSGHAEDHPAKRLEGGGEQEMIPVAGIVANHVAAPLIKAIQGNKPAVLRRKPLPRR